MVRYHFIFLVLVPLVIADSEIEIDKKKPLYKYRYETEDVMKTAASSIPVRGYHVVEGGYYPGVGAGVGGIGIGAGVGGIGIGSGIGGGIGPGIGAGIGPGGLGGYGGNFIGGPIGYEGAGIGLGGIGLRGAGLGIGLGYGGGLGGAGGAGFIGGPAITAGRYTLPHYGGYGGYGGGYGGGYVDKNAFNAANKNLNDQAYEKAYGQRGEEVNQGNQGFNKDIAAVRNNKGESGFYNNEGNGKNAFVDEKAFHGAQHYNREGKNGGQLNEKSGHKKGHVIKGFKTSHHKDESGKTEEFYDEENDEGGKLNYNNNFGAFGENAGSSVKGGHENGKVQAGAHKQEGHYENEHIIDNANAGKGSFGSRKYGGGGSTYGVNNGIDQQSILGHQEANRFYKHHPHVPFY